MEEERQWQRDVNYEQTANSSERDTDEIPEQDNSEETYITPKEPVKKQRGRPKHSESNANKEWDDEEIYQLIEAWRNLEQLYNVRHPKYHLKDERLKNLNKLKDELLENGIEVTVDQISKKMLSLKNHFSSEKRKIEASSTKSGSGTGDLYATKWQYYRHLLFLKDSFTPKATETNLKRQLPMSSSTIPSTESSARSNKKKNENRIEVIDKMAVSMADMTESIRFKRNLPSKEVPEAVKSEDSLFGEMITKMIENIPNAEEKYLLKLRIQQDIIQTKFAIEKFAIERQFNNPMSLPFSSPTNNSISVSDTSSNTSSTIVSPQNTFQNQ